MKKAYLETNIINKSLEFGLSGCQLWEKLNEKGLSPQFGIHGIYELARSFLNKDGKDKGVKLFRILQELDPSYQPTTEMILDLEIIKLRTGAAVFPILDPLNQVATKQEVDKLARGIFNEKARVFISNRESEIRINHPMMAMTKVYIDNAKNILNKRSLSKNNLRTFEHVLSELQSEFPDLIYLMLNGKVSRLESCELYLRLKSFPAIRTTTMANAYMTSICIIHGNIPGKEKLMIIGTS